MGLTVEIRRYGPGLMIVGPRGTRYIRPDETRLLVDGCQFAELIAIPDEGPAVVDGFAHVTDDEAHLMLRAGSHGWHEASLGAVRALIAGLSSDPVECVEVCDSVL